ncbi:hypothetical protein Pelo_15960 [Pelomyxa schiedti]|nr:hypothetical protein Pelo_15960 [Pelomyxa schiedti]
MGILLIRGELGICCREMAPEPDPLEADTGKLGRGGGGTSGRIRGGIGGGGISAENGKSNCGITQGGEGVSGGGGGGGDIVGGGGVGATVTATENDSEDPQCVVAPGAAAEPLPHPLEFELAPSPLFRGGGDADCRRWDDEEDLWDEWCCGLIGIASDVDAAPRDDVDVDEASPPCACDDDDDECDDDALLLLAQTVPGMDPDNYRMDPYGNLISHNARGTQSQMAWDVDHRHPLNDGGSNSIRNLDAVQHNQNLSKGAQYPYTPDHILGVAPPTIPVDGRCSMVRDGSLFYTSSGTVDRRCSSVRSGEVSLNSSGQIDQRCSAARSGAVTFKKS